MAVVGEDSATAVGAVSGAASAAALAARCCAPGLLFLVRDILSWAGGCGGERRRSKRLEGGVDDFGVKQGLRQGPRRQAPSLRMALWLAQSIFKF